MSLTNSSLGCRSLVECSPSEYEALGSISSTKQIHPYSGARGATQHYSPTLTPQNKTEKQKSKFNSWNQISIFWPPMEWNQKWVTRQLQELHSWRELKTHLWTNRALMRKAERKGKSSLKLWKCKPTNQTRNPTFQDLWSKAKAVLRGRSAEIGAYTGKGKNISQW